jgi:peroxiredoxin
MTVGSGLLLCADGNVEAALYGVKPEGHADRVLAALPA